MQAMTQIEGPPNLHHLLDTLRLSPSWPQPELCCGIFYCEYGKDKCWEAIHDVQAVYNNHLREEIEKLVNDQLEKLQSSTKTKPFFGHSIYMVGRKKKRSNPFIFFHCSLESPRSKAAEMLKASPIMKPYPAIRISHVPVPPESHLPPRYATHAETKGFPLATPYPVSLLHPKYTPSGLQVTIDCERSKVLTTIGGCVWLNEKLYGLTASHDVHHIQQEATTELEGDLFTYPGYDETSDSSDDDEEEEESDWDTPGQVGEVTLQEKEEQSSFFPDGEQDEGNLTADEVESLGTLMFTSMQNDSLGLDWALVEISLDDFVSKFAVNRIPTSNSSGLYDNEHDIDGPSSFDDIKNTTTSFKGVVTHLPRSSFSSQRIPVTAVTGRCGMISGWISGTSVSMMLPGATIFQELWSVRLDKSIEEGDSGSFVVDPFSGDVYGHIVAGDLEHGHVYIIPAYKVQVDIAQRLGDTFTFPVSRKLEVISAPPALEVEEDFAYVTWPRLDSSQEDDSLTVLSYDDFSDNESLVSLSRGKTLGFFDEQPDGDIVVEVNPLKETNVTDPGQHSSIDTSVDKGAQSPKRIEVKVLAFKGGNQHQLDSPPVDVNTTRPADSSTSGAQDSDVTKGTFEPLYPSLPNAIKKSLRSWRKTTWPDPEASTGELRGKMGGSFYWEVIGPAKKIWQSLASQIKVFLKYRWTDLSSSNDSLMIEMLMMGRSPQSSSPTIILSSNNSKMRKVAVKLLQQSSILDPFPGIKVATTSRGPHDYPKLL